MAPPCSVLQHPRPQVRVDAVTVVTPPRRKLAGDAVCLLVALRCTAQKSKHVQEQHSEQFHFKAKRQFLGCVIGIEWGLRHVYGHVYASRLAALLLLNSFIVPQYIGALVSNYRRCSTVCNYSSIS